MFLWTPCTSIKQIEAPYVFDWEHGIALHAMQGNRASSRGEGEVSWVFSSCVRYLGYILELHREWPLDTRVCSAKSGLLPIYDGHLGNLNEAWQDNTDASGVEAGDQASLSSFHSDILILINFQEESSIVTFSSIELCVPLEVSRDMRPPVQVTWGPRAFSRVSTGDSDIPSSCEMKYKPSFKPLQETSTFFRVRVCRYPLHLRQ